LEILAAWWWLFSLSCSITFEGFTLSLEVRGRANTVPPFFGTALETVFETAFEDLLDLLSSDGRENFGGTFRAM
jgi:hypothetical protein